MFHNSIISLMMAILAILAARAHGMTKHKRIMEGVVLRVSAYNYPPIFSIQKEKYGNFTYDGYGPDLINLMTFNFKMSFRYIHVDPSQVSEYGLGTAVTNQLVNNEVDAISVPMERSAVYLEKMDLLYPIDIANYLLLQPWPEEISRLSTPIRPFSLAVWLCVAGSIIVFVALTSFITLYHENKNQKMNKSSIWNVVYLECQFVIAVITSQGSNRRFTDDLSIRIVSACWLLVMIVLVYAFSGVLTAILSVPKLTPTADSFEQVLTRKDLQVTIERNSLLTQQLMDATTGTYKQIGDLLRQHPELLFGDIYHAVDNVLYHRCVYPVVEDMAKYFIRVDLKANGKCRMTASGRELTYYTSLHMGIRKGSPYTNILNNEFLLYFWENGFSIYMRRKYMPGTMHCRTNAKPKGQTHAFKLVDFTSAFFLFGIGLSISLLVFVLEELIGRWLLFH